MTSISSIVTKECDGMKLPDYLKREMKLSVTLIKKAKFGGVFINEKNVHMRELVKCGTR